MKKVLISGGNGFIGKAVQGLFSKSGFETGILTRSEGDFSRNIFHWDIQNGEMDKEALEFADVIIHLAGENIASGRWSAKRKKQILDSRVNAGKFLCNMIEKSDKKPEMVISASAVGYYGSRTTEQIFKEEDSPGDDFLAAVCVEWENSLKDLMKMNIPVNYLRIGLVLSSKGGALTKLKQQVKYGFGSPIGSGKQWMPWISLEDLSRLILHVIENSIKNEVFNAVAPQFINNHDLMKTLAKTEEKPFFMPNVPKVFLRTLFGEMSTILLEGSRVSAEKVLNSGFRFNHADLETALAEV